MNRLLIATSTLLLCGAAFAQTTYRTSPNGLNTTEGYQYCWQFGEWSEARMMFFDGEMRNAVMVMKEVALRPDYRQYYARGGMGRSWNNIKLDVSFCDLTKISTTFTQNPTSTPSRVFDASVTWPTLSGFPKTKPAAWSMRFPFSKTFLNNGAADICLDFDFTGGKMANGSRWSSTWYQSYYTDSFNAGDSAGGVYTHLGKGCVDSGFTNNASGVVFTNVYSNQYTKTPQWQNKYRVSTRTQYTAKGKPVIHAVSLFGNKTGTTFPGVSCEKIFIDITKPFFIFGLTAGTDARATATIDFPLIPYAKSLENIPFYMQGAWDDSSNSALRFTYGEETLLPPMPGAFKRKMIYQPDPTKTTGQLDTWTNKVINDHARFNPIFRYAQ